jgi:hypothetical protein
MNNERENTMSNDPKGDTSHLSCTHEPGYFGRPGTVKCDGCDRRFPSYRHPVEKDEWESPEWERHARRMQWPHTALRGCDVSREDYDDRGCEYGGTKDQHPPLAMVQHMLPEAFSY